MLNLLTQGYMLKQGLSNYWKTVVDTIQDGVMIVSTKGIIVSVNKAFESITGYSRAEVLGKSCSMLHIGSCHLIREQDGCDFCIMFKKGQLRMKKSTLKKKDGDYIPIIKNASVLKDDEGNVTGAVETITDITDITHKEAQIESFRRELMAEDRFCGMIGTSAQMQHTFDLIANAAKSDAPVIILGESGTGKELVAKAIHECGVRKKQPYIKFNCSALNESLLESELFGHVKGAFTGAHRDREGRFEAARGGDIFLDEIGDLPLSTQTKLLRVLEEKIIERVGDHTPIEIDVRIISATNKDLKQLVSNGTFREDFFYRINVIPISVPPLRERKTDIPSLADAFFRKIQLKSGKTVKGILNEALELMMHYRWPGNVRELKSALEYAFVSCNGPMIDPVNLPNDILQNNKNLLTKYTETIHLNEIKKQRLIDALKKSEGNKSEAARILGISRTSVWSQIKRFKIS